MSHSLTRAGAAEPGAISRAPGRPGLTRAIALLLGLPKTLLFNFRHFPFDIAVRLPVLVSHRTWLRETTGAVKLGVVRTGVVKIGFGDIGIFDRERSRTIWQVSGTVKFAGKADVGHGSRISVTGELAVGDGVQIAAESAIVAQSGVAIGAGTLISWDVLIIDTDGHPIFDGAGNRLNAASPIVIGNSVWVGCRSVVLKGVRIPDGVVVAAASTVTRSIAQANAIVAGSPARVVRENISWKR